MTGSDFIFLAIFLHGSWSCPLFYRYRFIFFQLRTELCNFRSFVLTQWCDKFYLFIISIVLSLTYHRSIINLFSSHLPLLDYKFYCTQLNYTIEIASIVGLEIEHLCSQSNMLHFICLGVISPKRTMLTVMLGYLRVATDKTKLILSLVWGDYFSIWEGSQDYLLENSIFAYENTTSIFSLGQIHSIHSER